MNLRSLDLNLLVALDALLAERHVTRAAERIGLSQPAMSNALSRLRAVFADDLLVRTAKGMQPTPRASELVQPLQMLLRQVERVFESDAGFDPLGSPRTFTVRMSDILGCSVLPELMARRPPRSRIAYNVVHLPPDATVDAIERDEVDVAISMGLDHTGSVRSETLMRDRMVCLMRKQHPAMRRKLTIQTFLDQEHARVAMSPTDLRFVDDVLSKRGESRRVALNVPHWLLVAHVLKATDLLVVMPRQLARTVMDADLSMAELPFRTAPFEWRMYWHQRHDQGKANRWLREQIRAVCTTLSR